MTHNFFMHIIERCDIRVGIVACFLSTVITVGLGIGILFFF